MLSSAVLPRGNVTFLVTGVEGSLLRWEIHGHEMAHAVGVHDRILQDSIGRFGGRIVKHVGDGVMAVFRHPDAALGAALGAQVSFFEQDWARVRPLRVRMGIHSGWGEPIGGDYVGSVASRAEHVADAGHGAQLMLSGSAVTGCRVPPPYALVCRGDQRLRDLAEPIELFQVVGPGLDDECIPLRTLDESVYAVPVQRTPLFGRERERRAAQAILREHRLLTLCGTGGVGKTRLAIQVAAEMAAEFAGGVRFVDFSSARATDDLAAVMRDQVSNGRARDHASAPPLSSLIRLIDTPDVLLVVDNCEHLVDQVAALLDELLQSCRKIKILATSRQRLRLSAEHVIDVDPLAQPDDTGEMDDPAVQLFLSCCSSTARPALTVEQIPTVRQICALVDRLPLGIELAAARTAYLPLDALAARLEEHHRVLIGRERETVDRHRSIDAMLQWSRDTLPPAERRLLDRLGVFAGSVDLAAIEEVCSDDQLAAEQILEVLASLIDRSLVHRDPSSGRFQMLHLMRTFAREQLFAQGELQAWERRHTLWCVSVVRDAASRTSGEQAERILVRRGPEIDTALERAISLGDGQTACELASGVWRSFEASGRAREGIELLRRTASVAPREHDGTWIAMSQGLASLLLIVGEVDEAIALLDEAIQVGARLGGTVVTTRTRNVLAMALLLAGRDGARESAERALLEFEVLGDERGTGYALSSMGMIAARNGLGAAAEHHYLKALAVFRSTGERRDAAAVLSNLGNLAHDGRDLLRAVRYFDGAAQLYREIDDQRGLALVLNNLALIALQRRDLDRANALASEAETLFDRIGDRPGAGAAQLNLANVASESGRRADALSRYSQAIETFRAAREVRGVLLGLGNLSEMAWSWGARSLAWRCEVDRATILFRLGLTASLNASLRTLAERALVLDKTHLGACLTEASTSLGTDEIEAVLTEAALVRPADEADASPTMERTRGAVGAVLTKREQEIIALLSEGQNNSEIAASLFISQRTVDAHLSHIRTKLGVADRVKLAVTARDFLGR